MTAIALKTIAALSHSFSLYPAAARPWWESMDPPTETDRTTSDLLNQADLHAREVHTPTENAAPAQTGMAFVTEYADRF